jgi:phosphonate transport system permease protein
MSTSPVAAFNIAGTRKLKVVENILLPPTTSSCKLGCIKKYVTIPEARAYMSNQFLFILTYNVRESAILGLVGAGGIGFYLIL